jgi:hypothetical protein
MSVVLSRLPDDHDARWHSGADDMRLLNLAHALTNLLAHADEYCTPGHRMGAGYRLMLAHEGAAVGHDPRSATARAVIRRLA